MLEPRSSWSTDWPELWRQRELLFVLAGRDVKVRYRETVLGIAWAVLQPLLTMLVFTLLFGRVAALSRGLGSTPYALHVLAGLLPWLLFSSSVAAATTSLLTGASLVSKVYFPRLMIPLACLGVALVDFAFGSLLLLGALAYFGWAPGPALALAPIFIAGVALAAAGAGAFAAALAAEYRDVRHAVPFLLQIGMFLTPVIYPSALLPERWRFALLSNPLSGLVDGFRAALLGLPVDIVGAATGLGLSGLVFLAGVTYFSRVERRFADIL